MLQRSSGLQNLFSRSNQTCLWAEGRRNDFTSLAVTMENRDLSIIIMNNTAIAFLTISCSPVSEPIIILIKTDICSAFAIKRVYAH